MENQRLDDEWILGTEDRFAARAKELRAGLGISQQEMARRLTGSGLKMHQSSVAKMERETDRRPIRLVEALMIARILGSTVEEMLAGPQGDAADRLRELEEARNAVEARHAAEMARISAALDELHGLVRGRLHGASDEGPADDGEALISLDPLGAQRETVPDATGVH